MPPPPRDRGRSAGAKAGVSTRSPRGGWREAPGLPLAVAALVALGYAGGHWLWYRGTPLGHGPVVDEQENLAFAEAIVRGELPREPFYRAGGYPLLLAALRGLGVPTAGLFSAALGFGVVLHAVNAAAIAQIAGVWFGRVAALAAGILCALNPVLVHYSTQALDAVPALTFFLLGLAWMAPVFGGAGREPVSGTWRWAGASAAWAVATLCRPNYLLVWGALVFLAVITGWRRRSARVAVAGAAGALLLAGFAGWQWRVSGEAGFLPWQGAYNLWAANEPGAHGRYYLQRTPIPPALARENPARMDSIYLFRQDTQRAPRDHHDLNAHWRRRFLERISGDPLGWLGQLARKAYAGLNDWEQYNNKTYAFHQARSPWLRWNPLGWGILLVLGVAGFARLAAEAPALAGRVALLAVAAAASVLVFFVSARFRLPLAALLTVLAGGALAAPGCWRTWPRGRQRLLALALVLAAGLTYSRFDDVRSRATFVMDHALIARTAFAIGDFAAAWTEANHALALQPTHRDALRVAVSAYYNQLATGAVPAVDREQEARWRERCLQYLALAEPEGRELRAVAALALWRADRPAEALAVWRGLGATASAVAARLLVGDPTVVPDDLARAPAPLWEESLVRLAAAHLRIAPPPGVTLSEPERARDVVAILFGNPQP